ncbi:MAG: hypothetical protein ABR577_11255 [Pyrinomonadaceae bacterium]
MRETNYFINTNSGWLCKHCRSNVDARVSERETRARFFTEGEAEDKHPRLSTPALARWRDHTRRTLVCPHCGIEETISDEPH